MNKILTFFSLLFTCCILVGCDKNNIITVNDYLREYESLETFDFVPFNVDTGSGEVIKIFMEGFKDQDFYEQFKKCKLRIYDDSEDRDIPNATHTLTFQNNSKLFIIYFYHYGEDINADVFAGGEHLKIEQNTNLFEDIIKYLDEQQNINDNLKHQVNVTGSIDSLIEPLKSSYIAGTKVEIKAYVVTDVSLHVFINNVEIPMSHFDSDYWGFEFIMPAEDITIHLTYDQFYGRNQYTFNELYSWVDSLGDQVDKVGIASNDNLDDKSFITINYSSDSADIDNLLNILDQPLVKFDENSDVVSGTSKTINYYIGEYFYSISFLDNVLIWNDFSTSQMFKFENSKYVLPELESIELSTLKFKYSGVSNDIKKINDDSFVEKYFGLNEIEFIAHNGSVPEVEVQYYVNSTYGKIELIDNSIFCLNNQFYNILLGEEYWAYNNID